MPLLPNKNSQKGFTIIELSIAMSLIGVLMFILLISSMNFINIYSKGITLKRVNQSGANIAQELQANLRRSGEVIGRYSAVGSETVATGLCTGNYSFIWSVYPSGAGSENKDPVVSLTYSDDSPIYFAKVLDPSKTLCTDQSIKPYKGNDPSQVFQSSELLGDGLVVRDPSTDVNQGGLSVVLSSDNRLATIVYTISTNEGDDIISDTTDRAGCNSSNNQSFCALNTFVVTAYAKGV